MALTERTEVDRCEVLADGTIQARTALVIERDGVEISRGNQGRETRRSLGRILEERTVTIGRNLQGREERRSLGQFQQRRNCD